MLQLTFFFTVFISVLFFSIFITSVIRKYSINKSILDIPNSRSSHTKATPKGGGISIVVSILLVILLGSYIGYLPIETGLYTAIPIVLVATVAWIDDNKQIPFYWRILFYSIAVIIVMNQFGNLTSLSIGHFQFAMPGLLGVLVTFLAVFWLTNLYNFMDGTDAIAALQAISAALLGGGLLYVQGEIGLALICVSIVASSLGFLYWNFPPAKIFMGDIGSCTLGLVFALLALLSDLLGALSVTLWCMLLSVFICDATFTLVKRVVKREKWYEAHKSHAYQKLVQMGWSHRRVALVFLGINLLIIWPFVIISYVYPDLTLLLSSVTLTIMFIIWLAVQYTYSKK